MSDTHLPGFDRAIACASAALDKKAYDLVILELGELTSVADYFVICSGRSDTQVQAIAEGVRMDLAAADIRALAIEGTARGQWVLLDYADVVVHVFQTPTREFYDLERLWVRAPRIELPEPLATAARALRTGTDKTGTLNL